MKNPNLPHRTAWHLLNRIRETWEDATGTAREQPREPVQDQKRSRGRPASMRFRLRYRTPPRISRALMSGPPKKRWSYLEEHQNRDRV